MHRTGQSCVDSLAYIFQIHQDAIGEWKNKMPKCHFKFHSKLILHKIFIWRLWPLYVCRIYKSEYCQSMADEDCIWTSNNNIYQGVKKFTAVTHWMENSITPAKFEWALSTQLFAFCLEVETM